MDSRRLIIFIIISIGLLLVWDRLFPKPVPQQSVQLSSTTNISTQKPNDSGVSINNDGKLITVTTDLVQAQISTVGGDIRELNLLKHGQEDNHHKSYSLFTHDDNRVYVVQTGLIDNGGVSLPTHTSNFTSEEYNYVLKPNSKDLSVVLKAVESNGIEIIKTFNFRRDSYVIDISYQIINNTANPLSNVSAYWRILRDDKTTGSQSKFVHTFTGAAYYSNENKFNKFSFSDIQKNDINYAETINNGWAGYIEHYFISMWLVNAYGYTPVCNNNVVCRLNIKPLDNNINSVGLLTDLPVIKPHASYLIGVPLFAGPEEYNALLTAAPELQRTRDYGWVYIFATPLFWLLIKLYGLIQNWGWSIIALTVIVKLVLYPLTRASYISMAKMKALAPKIEKLKQQAGDDKVKLQRGMMELYRSEKVNPIGGCLPMVLQIPVFIGLYWALLSSVELRQAHFLWIKDLSLSDPYYILPAILALTMFLQTFMSPPPTDPVQAKMMRIMPVAFSVMFFFFPSGLVVYWLANNILSITQQWYVNKHVTLRHKNRLQNNTKYKK
jgi:YidC/Oxa1 family membrane protein insertase